MDIRAAVLMACLSFTLVACGRAATHAKAPEAPNVQVELHTEQVGSVDNMHAMGRYDLASQPGREDLALFKERGVTRVINLRTSPEMPFDEAEAVKGLGLEYHHIPVAGPESLTDEVYAKLRSLLNEGEGRVLLHCASANRVGAVWLAKRVLDDGLTYEAALKEAHAVGLKSAGLESRAAQYIEAQRPQ